MLSASWRGSGSRDGIVPSYSWLEIKLDAAVSFGCTVGTPLTGVSICIMLTNTRVMVCESQVTRCDRRFHGFPSQFKGGNAGKGERKGWGRGCGKWRGRGKDGGGDANGAGEEGMAEGM